MNEIIEKYSNNILKNLDIENINKIINFLEDNNCNYIEDLITDYLDLFTIDYDYFIKRYQVLNEKYENKFLARAGQNMDLFEEFFY